jgi:predicted DNA-binding WGR domain protein
MNIFEKAVLSAAKETPPTICTTYLEVQDAAEAGLTWLVYLVRTVNGKQRFYELLGYQYENVARRNGSVGKEGRTTMISYELALSKLEEKLKKGYKPALG